MYPWSAKLPLFWVKAIYYVNQRKHHAILAEDYVEYEFIGWGILKMETLRKMQEDSFVFPHVSTLTSLGIAVRVLWKC